MSETLGVSTSNELRLVVVLKLRRIESGELKPGMYIEAVEGASDATFPRARFLVETAADVARLRKCGADHFIINTKKGLSPAAGKHVSGNVVRAAQATMDDSTAIIRDVFGGLLAGKTIDAKDIQPVVSMVSRSLDENPSVLLNVSRLKSKDTVTFQHSISVSALMVLFSRHLGFDEAVVEELGMAGLLHDVGKLEIDEAVLNKEGKLDDLELDLIRTHPRRGHDILARQIGVSSMMLDVCLNHHEKMDGTGYPGHLMKDQISMYARLAAICDVYDAVTTIRPYKTPWTPVQALKWMLGTSGHFDPKLLKKFVICLSTELS